MARNEISKKIEEQVRQAVVSYAFFRPESALVIALTIILVALSLFDLAWFPGPWWLWLLFGLAGEGLIMLTTLRDDNLYRQMLNEMFREAFDVSKLRNPDLGQKLAKALEYREQMVAEIEREEDPVLDDYLSRMADGLEDWIAQLYRLAQGLDTYQHDAVIARDMEAVPQELKRLRQLLSEKTEPTMRMALEKTIATKESQWETLKNLRDTMARAQLQIENTLSTMGTIYMQVRLLGAKDIDSNRVQRLQADMSEQVLALEDIGAAMDEVYKEQRN